MSNTLNNLADNTNWKPQSIVDMAGQFKEWWVSLVASVLLKGKDYFRNVLTSCQHSWQCNFWMSHYQVCWQLVTAFHKTGKLCYIRFVALRIPLIWSVKVLHICFTVLLCSLWVSLINGLEYGMWNERMCYCPNWYYSVTSWYSNI